MISSEKDLTNNITWRKQDLLQHMTEFEFRQLLKKNQLIRIQKGVYQYAHIDLPDNDMILAQELFPQAVISMLTAASYYNLTTIIPSSIQLTLPSNKSRRLTPPSYPQIEFFFANEKIIDLGIEIISEENYPLRIYNRERVVCDMFRYLPRVGLDAALDIFKNYMHNKKNRQLDKLLHYSRQLRVYKYIHRYTEVYIA